MPTSSVAAALQAVSTAATDQPAAARDASLAGCMRNQFSPNCSYSLARVSAKGMSRPPATPEATRWRWKTGDDEPAMSVRSRSKMAAVVLMPPP